MHRSSISTQLLLYTSETESKNGVIKTKSFEPLSFPHISGWCIDDSVEDLGLAEIKLCRVKMIVLTSKLTSLADTESSDIQMLRASLAYLGKLFSGELFGPLRRWWLYSLTELSSSQ